MLHQTGLHEDVSAVDDVVTGQLLLNLLQDAGEDTALVDGDGGTLGQVLADGGIPCVGAGGIGFLLVGHDLIHELVALNALFEAEGTAAEVDVGVVAGKLQHGGQIGVTHDVDELVLSGDIADGALGAGQDVLIDADVAVGDVVQVGGQGGNDHIGANSGTCFLQSLEAVFFQFHKYLFPFCRIRRKLSIIQFSYL